MPTPSTFHWVAPTSMGITGNGRQRMYPFWQLDLTWNNLPFDDYSTLLTNYLGAISGTITVVAPTIYQTSPFITGSNRYFYFNQVLLDYPIPGDYIDNAYYSIVKMSVRKVSLDFINVPFLPVVGDVT